MKPRRFLPGASHPDECQHCGDSRRAHEPLGACPSLTRGEETA